MTLGRRTAVVLGLVILFSLAVNLMVIGSVVTNAAFRRGPPGVGGGGGGGIVDMRREIDNFPEADRHIMGEAMRQGGGDQRALTATVKANAQAVREALLAEPFDTARFRAAIAQFRGSVDTLRQRREDAFADGVSRISPEARRQLSESPIFRPRGGDRGPPPGSSQGPPPGSPPGSPPD